MRINRHGVQVLEVSTAKRHATACFNFEGNRIYAEMCKQAYQHFCKVSLHAREQRRFERERRKAVKSASDETSEATAASNLF